MSALPEYSSVGIMRSPRDGRLAGWSLDDYDHVVYVRVFEGCNIRCSHCFIPNSPKRLTLDDVARVPEHVRRFAPPGSRLLIQWHGGEPTAFGADWLESAIDLVHRHGPEYRWTHGIQTNLISYDATWASLYRRHFNGMVGVSWDPGIRRYRDSNERFEEVFWSNLRTALADGITPYMVVTATRPFFDRFRNPMDFFLLLADHGVRYGHIERLTRTGEAIRTWDTIGIDNATYSREMSRFATAYVLWRRTASLDRQIHLSPFDGLFESVSGLLRGHSGGYGCWSGACDSRFHTIDADGYKKGCTALTADSSWSATVTRIPVTDFRGLRSTRQKNCHDCEYRPICSSGCHATPRVDASGECSGGYGFFKTISGLVDLPKMKLGGT